MELRKIHFGFLASTIVGLSGCANEGIFFQKAKKPVAGESRAEAKVSDSSGETPDHTSRNDDKHSYGGDHDELHDISHGTKKNSKNSFEDLLSQFGGSGLDIGQLGPLGQLLSVMLPVLNGSGGLGNLSEIIGSLAGGDTSLLDLFKNLSQSGAKPGKEGDAAKKPSIFSKVSSIPTIDTSEREDMFCAPAATVRAKSEGLSSLLDEICDADTAKSALIAKLIGHAYDGVSPLRFHTFRALASDQAAQTSSVRYAFAVKLPGTAKEHFDGVAPMQFDLDNLSAFVEAPGGEATISILENYDDTGDYHVRGILASQRLVRQVMGFEFVIESETRYDHYALEEEHYYLQTSFVAKSVEGINSTDTLSLIIQDEGSAYLIALVDIVSPNQGFAKIAESEIEKSAKATAAALYESISFDAE